MPINTPPQYPHDFVPWADNVKSTVDTIETNLSKSVRNTVGPNMGITDVNAVVTAGNHAWAGPNIPANWPANTGATAGLIENIAIDYVGLIQRVTSMNTIFVHVRKGAFDVASMSWNWTSWRQL